MDFTTLKRRDLQSLCKKNNIPANLTNAAMADALASLSTVEGIDEYSGIPQTEVQGSPERSVIGSPNAQHQTTTRQRVSNEELESSKVATRTGRGTRTRVVEGTDTKKTPATRTTRKRACQEASIKNKMEKDLQAEFEADLDQSEVSEKNVLPESELEQISEEVSEVTVETEVQALSESQNEVGQVDNGQKVIGVDDCKESQEEQNVNMVQEDSANTFDDNKEVDFHSFCRKNLQILCKKNKIPANMSNAAMADALKSLEIVEGLHELIEDCDSQALYSPMMSGIASSCARRSRTSQKTMKEEPWSSKLNAKSCRGSRRRLLEENEQKYNVVQEIIAAPSVLPMVSEAGSAIIDCESLQEKEDSAVRKSEQKKLVNSIVDNRECPPTSSDYEVDSPKSCEISGENDYLNAKKLKDLEETVSEMDENAKDDTVASSENDLDPQAVVKIFSNDEEPDFGSENGEFTNIQKSSNMENDADSESDDLVTAPHSATEQMSREIVSESTIQADQIFSLDTNMDSSSENIQFEKVLTFSVNAAAHSGSAERDGSSHVEDELSVESNTEPTIKANKTSSEVNVEGESETSYTEEEISGKQIQEKSLESDSESSCTEEEDFGFESTSQDQVSLETNVDILCEKIQLEKLDTTNVSAPDSNVLISNNLELTTRTDLCSSTEMNPLEKVDTSIDFANDAYTEDLTSRKYGETPLPQKSMRKLRKLLKEKLQGRKAQMEKLEKRLEALTLEETKSAMAKGEGLRVESELSGNENPIPQMVLNEKAVEGHIEKSEDTKDGVNNSDIDAKTLLPVDVVTDNISGSTYPPQSTPSKFSRTSLMFTTPTKTAKSAERKNCVLDVNKENIDSSANKTEPGKIKIVVTDSAMSLGKLKKECKMHQQSEKKRTPLQSYSQNNRRLG
ncbi:uncharacterized protein LOC130818642 isoform X2 [Amaranthus tricolor]|uniref:uncharacterized protein LOC130818642 isoform X2 n=1 Tax=Amaranthus tricolor TaxID=29722 RepID=UPI0025830ECA|nr:uncharacterized protein LOC130818642 isoform X2 [Amaranthus tricolor]